MHFDLIVIGAGAAGFFAAVNAKEKNASLRILIIEKTAQPLAKVRISGGGRCNVTHNCFDPKALTHNYPRGHKELLGPFYRFGPKETFAWFRQKGVELKIERDGRVFPSTNSSETIIDTLTNSAEKSGVEIRTKTKVESLEKQSSLFTLKLQNGELLQTKSLLLATGSSKNGHLWAKSFGHTVTRLIPSLFTFNIPNFALKDLSGTAVANARVNVEKLSMTGPVLITHFGFSGPAVIKLSAWAAPLLFDRDYKAEVSISWLGEMTTEELLTVFSSQKQQNPRLPLSKLAEIDLPKKLKKHLLGEHLIKPLGNLSNTLLQEIAKTLTCDCYQIEGKTTNKEEFVTCGGIKLSEINFKTMESKLCPNLYFAGEILDIDGITGGFNFQNAWTGGFLAAEAIAQSTYEKKPT